MSAPIIFTSRGSSTKVVACTTCKSVVSSTMMFGDGPGALDQAIAMAADHCTPASCETCGAAVQQFHTSCSVCDAVRRRAGENQRFASATKVSLAEYARTGGEWLWREGWGHDGYVRIDDIEEELDRDGAIPPLYMWACDEHGFPTLDAMDLLGGALDEMHEGASEQLVNIEGLQATLDAWCKLQTVKSYTPNKKTVVLIENIYGDKQ